MAHEKMGPREQALRELRERKFAANGKPMPKAADLREKMEKTPDRKPKKSKKRKRGK